MRNRVRALPIEILVGGSALALTLGSIAVVRFRFREPPTFQVLPLLPIIGVFFVAIVLGEMFRVGSPAVVIQRRWQRPRHWPSR